MVDSYPTTFDRNKAFKRFFAKTAKQFHAKNMVNATQFKTRLQAIFKSAIFEPVLALQINTSLCLNTRLKSMFLVIHLRDGIRYCI